MKTCWKMEGGPYSEIKLMQAGIDNFRVIYGQDPKGRERLTYNRAALALGAAIMHRMACEDELDNREKE
jgi:hypothetical protein